MKTFSEFLWEQRLIIEMSEFTDASKGGIKTDAKRHILTYDSVKNSSSDPERVEKHHPKFSMMYKLPLTDFSHFQHWKHFSTHTTAYKEGGDSIEGIRNNIRKVHSMTGKPILSDDKQTNGGAHIWEKWKTEEPENIHHYKIEIGEDGEITPRKIEHSGSLINGDPNLRMGYSK